MSGRGGSETCAGSFKWPLFSGSCQSKACISCGDEDVKSYFRVPSNNVPKNSNKVGSSNQGPVTGLVFVSERFVTVWSKRFALVEHKG
jgi:hypothetical protein